MSAFKRLFYRFFRPYQAPPEAVQSFALDAQLHASLQSLADQQQRSLDQVANDLIQQALGQNQAQDANQRAWDLLSPRQQEIAALICLDYTNQQIALRLSISPQTVKSHVRAVLKHFDLHSKTELRRRLGAWDFSAWKGG